MRAIPILLGCIATVLVVSLLPKGEPPTELTPRQKRDIVSRMHTEIMVGQLLYDLPTIMPPAVTFELSNGNAAESECQSARVRDGHPDWTLRVNERLAASHWREFLSETIPHEVGHFVRCQTGDVNWTAHDARWSSIVRELGAEPKEHHRYAN